MMLGSEVTATDMAALLVCAPRHRVAAMRVHSVAASARSVPWDNDRSGPGSYQ